MVNPIPLHPAQPGAPAVPVPATAGPAAPAAANDASGKVVAGRFGPGRRAAPPRLNAQERAFLPAALEVIETPASPALRWTALVLCGLVAGAIVWSCLARIDTVAVAAGKVVPMGQVKVVQPLETALIRAIHVREGDGVAAGQLLVELDPSEVRADLDALAYNRLQAALDAEVARVLATRDPAEPLRAPEGADPVLVEQNRMQAQREIERHLASLAGLEADLDQKRAGLEANAAQVERTRLVLPLIEERLATARGLFDKQFGARPPVLDAQQQLVERRADLKAAQGAARQIEAEARSLRAKAEETRAAFLAEATDRRTKALQRLAGLEQDLAKARQRERARRLHAPVAGTAQGVKVHTPGAVVTSADVLMTVVPAGAGIEVDAGVLNGDIGFVSEGQAVQVKLDAFPFTRYGLVNGRVRTLGRDAATPQAPGAAGLAPGAGQAGGAGDLAYPAKIALEQDWILVEGRREPIRPGMRVSAEIRTGERRVIEFLLSPVVQAVKEAGRER